MARRSIIIGTSDMNVLKALVSSRVDATWRKDPNVRKLDQEIDRAKIVPDAKVPADVVRLGCEVHVREAGKKTRPTVYHIVLPHEASFEDGRIYVMSPIGTGLLGYRVGDTVTWPVPGGERTWTIEQVVTTQYAAAAGASEEAA